MKIQYIFNILFIGLISTVAFADNPPSNTPSQAAIASANPYATQAGLKVLKQGGNAFDAAIAVAGALAVVEPYNSGIGGGGFFLIYDAKQNQYFFIDAREKAPAKASPNMYQNTDSHNNSVNGPLAAGIPGEVAGLAYLSQHYAKLKLQQDLQPAITAAQQGFAVDAIYQNRAATRLAQLQAVPATAAIFLVNQKVPPLGTLIKQPALAQTLQRIAQTQGKDFYAGQIAKELSHEVAAAGGLWQLTDLQSYKVSVRQPLMARYKDLKIVTAPLPSAGGVALITMLNILNVFPYDKLIATQQTHYMLEIMRRVYLDRYLYLGDPDYVDVPVALLTSQQHANELLRSIKPQAATPSQSLLAMPVPASPAQHTTHFSIIDKNGNMVAATLSLNYSFGSGFVAQTTGVLLNDQMDDFTTAVDKANLYGLPGSRPNLIAPGKRPLSSMTPTFLITPDKVAILGTPGGSRIVTMVMLATVAILEGKTADAIVSMPRYHMQLYPDVVEYESGAFSDKMAEVLRAMGYQLNLLPESYGNMQLILWDKKNNRVTAASDPRGAGVTGDHYA